MVTSALTSRRQIAVDANLLLLLVVGQWNPHSILKHKRLSEYTIRDFELVRDFVSSFESVAATAHVLTEVSNLAAFATGEVTTAIYQQLAQIVSTLNELPISSKSATECPEFFAFGLTDAAQSTVCSYMPLLTEDKPLAAHLQRKGFDVWTLERLKNFRNTANNGG